MVMPSSFGPRARKLIDTLAAGAPEGAVPFVELPASVGDFDALMQFDRETCARLPVFRRRLHPREFPVPPSDLRTAGAFVTVRALANGLRSRVITEGPR